MLTDPYSQDPGSGFRRQKNLNFVTVDSWVGWTDPGGRADFACIFGKKNTFLSTDTGTMRISEEKNLEEQQ
jgi:hypothetical protein